jgi:hypothetical protein
MNFSLILRLTDTHIDIYWRGLVFYWFKKIYILETYGDRTDTNPSYSKNMGEGG